MNEEIQKLGIVVTEKGIQEVYEKLRKVQEAADDAGLANTKAGDAISKAYDRAEKALNDLKNSANSSAASIKRANEALAKTQDRNAFEASIAGLDRLAQASARVEYAQRNLQAAQDKVNGLEAAGKTRGLTSAIRDQEKATRELTTAEKALSAAKTASDKQADVAASREASRALRDQAKAERELADAQNKVINDRLALERKLGKEFAKETQSRNYNTLSVQADSAIAQRQQDAKAFSASLKARLREEEAARRATEANNGLTGSLPRLRYALYDVSTTLAFAGAAMLGLGIATVGTAIKMDRQFADVVRTTGTYLQDSAVSASSLRQEFNALFTSLPARWDFLTQVGTLAGQLGVASENVAEFTELVTKFSVVSGMSAEASATAFGRLSELLNVSASEYENLGSAILATGTSSVATEEQIVNISSQIASMGSFVNMSADEVIGLSAALASLGVQPELSRGVITRLFTNITTAIENGGARLDAFASLTQKSAQEFATAWRNDATSALLLLMDNLGRLEADGGDAVGVLREMGITASRDVPTILKLAQNSKLLAEQLEISADGFDAGTAIQEQYGVIADTVAEKLTVLTNNLTAFVAALGQSNGALSPVIDMLTALVKTVTAFVSSPVGQFVAVLSTAFTVLGGVLLLVVGAAARGAASVAALFTAMQELNGASIATKFSLAQVQAQMVALGISSRAAAVAVNGVKVALGSTGIGLGLVIAGTAITALWEGLTQAKQEADALSGSLKEAILSDTASGEGITKSLDGLVDYGRVAESVTLTQEAWNRVFEGSSTYAEEFSAAVEDASKSVEGFQAKLGEQTKNEVINAFLDNEEFRNAFADGLLPEELDFNRFADILIQQGQTAGMQYLDSLFNPEAMKKRISELDLMVVEYNRGLTDITKQEYLNGVTELSALKSRLDAYNSLAAQTSQTTSALGTAITDAAYAQRVLESAAQGAEVSLEDQAAAIESVIKESVDFVNTILSTQDAISSLGSSLAENGNQWSVYSEAGRSNIQAVIDVMEALQAEGGGNAAAVAADMKALFDFLVAGGYASAEQLVFLRQAILNLPGGSQVESSGRDFSSFFNGWASGASKAGSATNRAAKEVRTLLDYASDLSKVWDRAFAIRFDSMLTYDAITSTFQDLRDAADEAARKIAELQTEISGLNVDIQTQQYFLSIATEYGDTQRAAEIQQTLLELQDELAAKQDELSKEQAANSKVLTGNSKAAITNRKTLTDLVSEYQEHINALAESGMSTAELASATARLKQDFLDQATALGFATSDLSIYASAFDDVALAIQRVPRNITVAANTNPALQALNEFMAEARRVAGAGIPVPFTGNPALAGDDAGKKYADAFVKRIAAIRGTLLSYKDGSYRYQLSDGSFTEKFYAEGGYTGAGGKYEPAGIVHRGEYVIPKRDVNQRTGLPYADAFQRISRGSPARSGYAAGGYVAGSGGRQMVDLSPTSIQYLAAAVKPLLALDSTVLAGAVSNVGARGTRGGNN